MENTVNKITECIVSGNDRFIEGDIVKVVYLPKPDASIYKVGIGEQTVYGMITQIYFGKSFDGFDISLDVSTRFKASFLTVESDEIKSLTHTSIAEIEDYDKKAKIDFIVSPTVCPDEYDKVLLPNMTKEQFDFLFASDGTTKKAVNCRTRETAREFLKLANQFGYEWRDGTREINGKNIKWAIYKEKTVYHLYSAYNEVTYSDINYMKSTDKILVTL